MEKLNIAEVLKNCPTGMELDCLMYEDVYFDYISDCGKFIYCYINYEDRKTSISFNKYGAYANLDKSKCVLFPKGKTTWEGFVPPCKFKDGDVVVAEDNESFQLFLLKHLIHSKDDNTYDGYCYFGWDFQCNELFEKGNWGFNRLATEEEKAKLFKVIKDNGYHWNDETTTLEKLPKFKVGDRIKDKNNKIWFVVQVSDKHFSISLIPNAEGYFVPIEDQDDYKLLPDKFDINTLKPFESRVLVRNDEKQRWLPAFWGYKVVDGFITTFGWCKYCVPFEGCEHLWKTNNDCDDFYKIWE